MSNTVPAFTLPPKGELSYLYFGHVSFAVSDGEHVVLIDPFFCGRFEWRNKTERHLEMPTMPLASVKPVSAVLVSHEHGDHWDKATLETLRCNNPGCRVVAPRTTIDLMKKEGVEIDGITQASMNMSFNVGAMKVTLFPSIESENAGEPVQRVGFLVEHNGAALYHQGDSHGPAKAWQAFRERLDTIIIWPIYVDSYVYGLRPPSIIFHHMDRFEPGDFFCNKDALHELSYWRNRYPEIHFTSPRRNTWLSVKTHKVV